MQGCPGKTPSNKPVTLPWTWITGSILLQSILAIEAHTKYSLVPAWRSQPLLKRLTGIAAVKKPWQSTRDKKEMWRAHATLPVCWSLIQAFDAHPWGKKTIFNSAALSVFDFPHKICKNLPLQLCGPYDSSYRQAAKIRAWMIQRWTTLQGHLLSRNWVSCMPRVVHFGILARSFPVGWLKCLNLIFQPQQIMQDFNLRIHWFLGWSQNRVKSSLSRVLINLIINTLILGQFLILIAPEKPLQCNKILPIRSLSLFFSASKKTHQGGCCSGESSAPSIVSSESIPWFTWIKSRSCCGLRTTFHQCSTSRG